MEAEHQPKLLRWPQVRDAVGLSRTTVWRLVREDKFPAPVQLNSNSVAWRSDLIAEWIKSRPVATAFPTKAA